MNPVDEYLAKLPAERRDALAHVRAVVNANIPPGFEEKIQYGMISWCVPESALPASEVYNKQPLCLASLASQKNHMAIYMLHIYGDPSLRSWFEQAYANAGKKLDMGQSCVRFKSLDALPIDVIGEAMSKVTVDNYVAAYRRIRDSMKKGSAKTAAKKSRAKPSDAKKSMKTSTTKKAAAKKPAAKKPAKRR